MSMNEKVVRYSLDALPPLTEGQQLHLEELASRPDDQINASDIPELTDAQLAEIKPASRFRKGQALHGA